MTVGLQQIFEEHEEMRKVLKKVIDDKSYSNQMAAYLLDKDTFHEAEWLMEVMEASRES
jgi:formiminotetrahydrofolate cyclodeaminase